jgi:hypothetical protein
MYLHDSTQMHHVPNAYTSKPAATAAFLCRHFAPAGGLLPPSVKNKVPAAVSADADTEYKDYRSYYKYMCLPMGFYNLNMYDSYGDGWDGGRITITQMVNASAGCQLLSETLLTQISSKAVAFAVTVRVGWMMQQLQAACLMIRPKLGKYNCCLPVQLGCMLNIGSMQHSYLRRCG